MGSKIIVEGFKSIGERVEVEVRPLTLLAGANSSGKSSLMQAILLLKQTLEAPFDPGPIWLNGPNVKLTSFDQLVHIGQSGKRSKQFTLGIAYTDGTGFETLFHRSVSTKRFEVKSCQIRSSNGSTQTLHSNSRLDHTQEQEVLANGLPFAGIGRLAEISRRYFTLKAKIKYSTGEIFIVPPIPGFEADLGPLYHVIHVPGLRGDPERAYPLTATGPTFPGTFDSYTASLISDWATSSHEKLRQLGKNLQRLGLTWKVEAKKVDDANVELRVGRLPRPAKSGTSDVVNIADVGLGVSQSLPVLVALLEARPGQLVFIEQPEIHLHPKAQVAMAGLLADAAKRGVQLVIETHSSLLLLAVQTLVAEGDLDPNLVKLHWFTRDPKSGASKITSADLDEAGRFGDWPEDFDDVMLGAQSKYLDAVEAAMAKE